MDTANNVWAVIKHNSSSRSVSNDLGQIGAYDAYVSGFIFHIEGLKCLAVNCYAHMHPKSAHPALASFGNFAGLHRARLFLPMAFLLHAWSFFASAATPPSGCVETTVASGIASPTAMAIAPDEQIFVCSQSGALRVIK